MKVALPLLLFGYTLVYAGIAAGGAFAENPWRGFVDDAYEVAGKTATPSGGATSIAGKILHDVFGVIPGGNVDLAIGKKILGWFGL